MAPTKTKAQRAEAALRELALGYPEAFEDFPWGERVFKVKKKIFLFLGREGEGLTLATKLPESGLAALALPFAEPTGYGLGKAGWVTLTFGAREKPPLELLRRFVDESYRAVAPKKLLSKLRPPTL
jgi:predicted DNA-binding protein (MmcQ/YjbR family)